MGILNDIINDFQKEKLNAQYLKDYDYDFIDGEWNWPIINGVIDLLQGITSSVKDLVIGVVWIIQPWHWDDVISESVYTVTHLKKVIPAVYNEIKTTYKEQGLIFGIGYILPEVAAYFLGVGEIKSLSEVEKIEDVSELSRYVDEATNLSGYSDELVDIERLSGNFDDFNHSTATNIEKGNYGEYRTAQEIANGNIDEFAGYNLSPVEGIDNYPDSLNTPPQKGIDHMYKNGNPPPDYIVVESKYNTSQLNTLSDGTKQMSGKWITDRLPDGIDKYADIDRYISRVMPDGSVTITKLD